MSDSDRIRPVPFQVVSFSPFPFQEPLCFVPVVFLLFAFSDQLYFLVFAAG